MSLDPSRVGRLSVVAETRDPEPRREAHLAAPPSDVEARIAHALTGRPLLHAISSRPPAAAPSVEQAEADVEIEDRTAVEAHPASEIREFRVMAGSQQDAPTFSGDLLDELRRKLREAEAREEAEIQDQSGVREIPSAAQDRRDAMVPPAPSVEVASIELAPPVEPEPAIAPVEPAPEPVVGSVERDSLESLDDVLSALPEIEVSLAPHSESNFYAGFDDEHPQGVFVATYTRLAVGTPVFARVFLPGGHSFRTEALVEWVREAEAAEPGMPAGLGLSLCGLDHGMERLVRVFVRHRKPIFFLG